MTRRQQLRDYYLAEDFPSKEAIRCRTWLQYQSWLHNLGKNGCFVGLIYPRPLFYKVEKNCRHLGFINSLSFSHFPTAWDPVITQWQCHGSAMSTKYRWDLYSLWINRKTHHRSRPLTLFDMTSGLIPQDFRVQSSMTFQRSLALALTCKAYIYLA